MKTLFLVMTVLASMASFAVDENSSLSDLYYSDSYDFDMPQYWIGGNTSIWATSVCIEGESIRTKTTRRRCTKHVTTDGGDNGWKCVEYSDIYLYAPINYTKKYCTDWGNNQEKCVGEWIDEERTLPLSFDVKVFKSRMTGDGDKVRDPFVEFTKSLVVPNC